MFNPTSRLTTNPMITARRQMSRDFRLGQILCLTDYEAADLALENFENLDAASPIQLGDTEINDDVCAIADAIEEGFQNYWVTNLPDA